MDDIFRRPNFHDFPEMKLTSEDDWINLGWCDDGNLLYERQQYFCIQKEVAKLKARQREYWGPVPLHVAGSILPLRDK
jgi:hypothetical protein